MSNDLSGQTEILFEWYGQEEGGSVSRDNLR